MKNKSGCANVFYWWFIADVFVFGQHQERLLHDTGLQWPELQEMLWQEETDVTEKSKRNHKKQVIIYEFSVPFH